MVKLSTKVKTCVPNLAVVRRFDCTCMCICEYNCNLAIPQSMMDFIPKINSQF